MIDNHAVHTCETPHEGPFLITQGCINGTVKLQCGVTKISSKLLTSSMFVSDVCGLMRRILYLIFVTPHCNVTVPLVQHCVITSGTLYGVSYLHAA